MDGWIVSLSLSLSLSLYVFTREPSMMRVLRQRHGGGAPLDRSLTVQVVQERGNREAPRFLSVCQCNYREREGVRWRRTERGS